MYESIKTIKSVLLRAALLAAFVFSLFAYEDELVPNPNVQRTFVIAGALSDPDLNPRTSTYSNEAQILNALYEGLFSYDPRTLDPIPAIASDYKIARNKKSWTFTIRDEAKFSDGTPITAETIRQSWLDLQKTTDAQYASLLDIITNMKEFREGKVAQDEVGIKASGNKLILDLNHPAAHLPRILCHHSFAAFNGDTNVFSGAFALKQKSTDRLVLEKNANYWDADNVILNEICVLFSEDEADNTWMFNTGRVDWVPARFSIDKLLNKNSIRISALFGTTYLFFTCRNKPWDSADLRRALVCAVPWDKIRAGVLIQADSLVYPISGYPEPEGLSDTDEEEALFLIKKAKKAAGIDENAVLELTFGIADSEYMRNQAMILQEAWKPLGVKLNIQTTPDSRYLASIPSWDADIFSYSWIGDFADPLAFLELFREGSTLNQTVWKNEEFTKLLEEADEETNDERRNNLLSQAEQVLLDDGMIMPVAHSVSLHAIDLQTIGGWYINALDIHPFKYLYFKDTDPSAMRNVAREH